MRYAITLFRLFIYTWHFTVKKKMHPCLLRGYLANIFNGLLLTMHYVKRVCKKNCVVFYYIHTDIYSLKRREINPHSQASPLEVPKIKLTVTARCN